MPAAPTYRLLPPTLPLPSSATGGAQEGYGEKSGQCSQRDRAQKQTDRRLLLTPASEQRVFSLPENRTTVSELQRGRASVTVHRKELRLVCYSCA